LGFISFCDNIFYYDLIDFSIEPDSYFLYDQQAGILLSVTNPAFELDDDLMEDEDNDNKFDEETDLDHN